MLGRIIGKFDKEAKSHMERQSLNPFSGSFSRSPSPRLSKDQYGKPLAGSKTEERGQKAKCHILREIQDLCNCIHDVGIYNKVHRPSDDSDDDEEPQGDEIIVTFGEIFQIYTKINDKVVGLLIAAKKRGFLFFEKEILFQRRDDNVLIALIKPIAEIRAIINKELAANASPVPFIMREESPSGEGKSELEKSDVAPTVNGNHSPALEQNSIDSEISKLPNEVSKNIEETKIETLGNANPTEKPNSEDVSKDLNSQQNENNLQTVEVVAVEEKTSDPVPPNGESKEQKPEPQLEITLESGTSEVDKDVKVSLVGVPQSQTPVIIPIIEISADLSLNDIQTNVVPLTNQESQQVSSDIPLDNTTPSETTNTEQTEISELSTNPTESANQSLIGETVEGIDNIKLDNEGIDSINVDKVKNGIQENVSVENQHTSAPAEENNEQERPTSSHDRLESDLPVHESEGEIQITQRREEKMETLTAVTPDRRPSPDRSSSPDPCDEEVQQILESQVSIPIIETNVNF